MAEDKKEKTEFTVMPPEALKNINTNNLSNDNKYNYVETHMNPERDLMYNK